MTSESSPHYGPFHRFQDAELNELVERSGRLRGKPRRNIYAGAIPAVKAYSGPLPAGRRGIEFVTTVPPARDGAPGEATWPEGLEGVRSVVSGEEVEIPVKIVKRVD